MADVFHSFREFYPYYLDEHRHPTCRRLHFTGTALTLLALAAIIASGRWGWLWVLPLLGYGFAWVGHFVYEKNRPATFRHPWYSLLGDFALFRDMLSGRIPF